MKWRIFKAAFPYTLPVCMGYLFLGIAFGVLSVSKGLHPGWAVLMSAGIYAGSMQFVAIDLLSGVFAPLTAALVTLMVNARHLFYGLSMLDRFKICGKFKPYMMFSMSDETYSLLCLAEPPAELNGRQNKKWFMFFIALLDQSYWIIGTVIGSLAGSLISFDSTGIDFAMTALFLVIFVDQWESTKNYLPALTGLVVTFFCLMIFGSEWFVLASMAGIFLCMVTLRSHMEKREAV